MTEKLKTPKGNTNTLCTICARGGSKGVKNKNIRLVKGIPLIAHTVQQALETQLFEDVVVSTDSDDIAEAASKFGASVFVKRPAELATDKAGKIDAIRHAFNESERHHQRQFDYLIDLDVTSPLRNVNDILGVYEKITLGQFDTIITGAPARRSPYFNLVEVAENGMANLSKAGSGIVRRQDSPACYDMNASIYAWTRESILNAKTVFDGKVGFFEMPEERSIDIDSELDFRIVKALMEKQI